jgi:hypothetical protein
MIIECLVYKISIAAAASTAVEAQCNKPSRYGSLGAPYVAVRTYGITYTDSMQGSITALRCTPFSPPEIIVTRRTAH